jgi:ribosomal protein S18 acetylase RimI-like enzyme
MEFAEFVEFHSPHLERDEVRNNLLLGIFSRPPSEGLRFWTLGGPGACAVHNPNRAIVLGDLNRDQCRRLAEQVAHDSFRGVVGCDDTATWFVERATELGQKFGDPIPHQIHELRKSPVYPHAPGHSRVAGASDFSLLAKWILAFIEEAAPHERRPSTEELQKTANSGNCLLWIVNDQPVSLATISRRTRNLGSIAPVYTPPPHRRRGYAGSVTAAAVERIFAEGKTAACLYTDTRNPYSNRCYAKIGFVPVCRAAHYPRLE